MESADSTNNLIKNFKKLSFIDFDEIIFNDQHKVILTAELDVFDVGDDTFIEKQTIVGLIVEIHDSYFLECLLFLVYTFIDCGEVDDLGTTLVDVNMSLIHLVFELPYLFVHVLVPLKYLDIARIIYFHHIVYLLHFEYLYYLQMVLKQKLVFIFILQSLPYFVNNRSVRLI